MQEIRKKKKGAKYKYLDLKKDNWSKIYSFTALRKIQENKRGWGKRIYSNNSNKHVLFLKFKENFKSSSSKTL